MKNQVIRFDSLKITFILLAIDSSWERDYISTRFSIVWEMLNLKIKKKELINKKIEYNVYPMNCSQAILSYCDTKIDVSLNLGSNK